MYRTCLFCHGDLGSNEVVESFPVGSRLAFDGERGRLWVVCPRCDRWNLSPLEERWEAIERCERRFRGERLRAETPQVGMARLRGGTELIRVGRPVRPEFAAWRYGDQLGRRMRRGVARIGAGTLATAAVTGAVAAGGVLSGAALALAPLAVGGGAWGLILFSQMRGRLRPFRVPAGDDRTVTAYGADLRETALRPDRDGDGWLLSLRHGTGWSELRGETARRALGVVLPRVNRLGAGRGRVVDAASLVEASGGAEGLLARIAAESRERSGDYLERRARFRREGRAPDPWGPDVVAGTGEPIDRGALPHLRPEERLALEMAVHEETERRAMEDELRPMLAAWREAEEIAAIADRLTTPPEHERWIAARRSAGE